jgi:UDP-N-acetylmuramoyl-tripeptide--D-alanyl-D-alanine ligase
VFFLADILEALTGSRFEGASLAISEATIDSRQVIPAAMFVALPGERVDGHNYVGEAFRLGASLALVQRPVDPYPMLDLSQPLTTPLKLPAAPFCLKVDDTLQALQTIAAFWRSQLKVKIIGITGSVGKSTTKELVFDVLSQRFRTLKSPGNMNNEIGLPLALLRLGRGHQRAVLEMGFYLPGEIAFLCNLAKPQIGVITNIGTVHAERAGSQEAIAMGKAELVRALPKDGVAILNYDDPWVHDMDKQTRARVFYYGLDPKADLWADHIEGLGLAGIKFQLHYQNEILHLHAPLIGRHSVHTILRATAVGLVEEMTWQDIVSGLLQGRSQLRLVAVHTRSGALLLDDTYNASPESTLAALNLLSELDGRKIAILGDMLELGPYEKQGHRMVGVRVAEICDVLVAVGPRSRITVESAHQAGMPQKAITWFETAPDAVEFLREQLKNGDTALVKGSLGMGMARIVSALETES